MRISFSDFPGLGIVFSDILLLSNSSEFLVRMGTDRSLFKPLVYYLVFSSLLLRLLSLASWPVSSSRLNLDAYPSGGLIFKRC